MEENVKTAFVIGIIVFIIYFLFLTYASIPDPVSVKSIEYQETPAEEAPSLYTEGAVVLEKLEWGWKLQYDDKMKDSWLLSL